MEYLTTHEEPTVRPSYLITAFKGWPDAGEGASSAIRYLLRKLPARKFAEMDSEEFYDFTQVRPQTSITREGVRVVKWPANELFYWAGPESSNEPSESLMFFLGVEPNLKWRTFSRAILDAAESRGVKTVVHVGSLLDAVPHTRAIRITGSSNRGDLKKTLERHNINSSNYQGPTGITSAMMEACTARGINFGTIWGHTPHYLQAAPNHRVGYTLVSNLSRLLGFQGSAGRATLCCHNLRPGSGKGHQQGYPDQRLRAEAGAELRRKRGAGPGGYASVGGCHQGPGGVPEGAAEARWGRRLRQLGDLGPERA